MRTYLDSLQRAVHRQHPVDLERAISNAPTREIRADLEAILPDLDPEAPSQEAADALYAILQRSVAPAGQGGGAI